MTYRHLETHRRGAVEHLTLHRPDVRNAFNDEMVEELATWAEAIRQDGHVRVAVLAGEGATFCAGAEVGWMSRMLQYTEEENVRDAERMAQMFEALDQLPVPLVGRVQGAALGGGAGLVAVCDAAVAEDGASFGFTEVRLGILPSVIAPFAVAKIGQSAARELFLTGRRFDADRAREIGLIHEVVPATSLDATVESYVHDILLSSPTAVARAKALIRQVAGRPAGDVRDLTSRTIAGQRVSPEGQEGLRAFLEKRKPGWHPEH